MGSQTPISSPYAEQLSPLWENYFIDGLRTRLITYVGKEFPSLSHDKEIADEIVTKAFDRAVQAISAGKEIKNISAWFYKTVHFIALDRCTREKMLQNSEETIRTSIYRDGITTLSEEDDDQYENLIREACEIAETLLPRIGTGQVFRVMELFLQAIKNDMMDYQPKDIAEVLGIGEPQARTLLHRGLTRLNREAEKTGVTLPSWYDPDTHEVHGSPFSTLDQEED